MAFLEKIPAFSGRWFRDYAFIIVGSFIIAAGYVLFITPYKIVPGGVYGITIILHHTIGTPVGLMALCFNIPLTIFGIKVLGPRFGAKTVVGFILTSTFMDGLTYFYGSEPLVENDPLVSALFGGAVIGVGVGLLFRAKATCGGTDVMAMILGKWTGNPLGQMMMTVDTLIVLAGTVVFQDWALPMYSLIAIFVMGKVIDVVLQGVSYDKVVLIVSRKHEEIREVILFDIHRGGTFFKSEGMYNGTQSKMIYVVLNNRELAMLKDRIKDIDSHAFVTVLNAYEILGSGFKSLKDEIEE